MTSGLEINPEAIIRENLIKDFRDQGWSVDCGRSKANSHVFFVLGTPDNIRLLEPDELVEHFKLRDGEELVKPGFKADYSLADERGFVLYDGAFDLEAVTTLAGMAALADSKPE